MAALLLEYPLEYNFDTSLLCRTCLNDVWRTRMTTLAVILSELFPLMVSDAVFCPLYNLSNLVYYHDTLQLCRIDHDDVSSSSSSSSDF